MPSIFGQGGGGDGGSAVLIQPSNNQQVPATAAGHEADPNLRVALGGDGQGGDATQNSAQ